MRKIIFVLALLILSLPLISSSFAAEVVFVDYDKFVDESPLVFYIPEEKEYDGLTAVYSILDSAEASENPEKYKDDITSFYDELILKEQLSSLIFEAFLRATQNEGIKKITLDHIRAKNYDDKFSKSIVRLYNSEKIDVPEGVSGHPFRFVYKQGKCEDEFIDLYHGYPVSVFNDELRLGLSENSWAMFTREEEDDAVALICGGGTNSLALFIRKFEDVGFKDFKKKAIEDFALPSSETEAKITVVELPPNKGILHYCNADKIYFGFSSGVNEYGILDGWLILFLYSQKDRAGYRIAYYSNFSRINNNLELADRIWSTIAFNLLGASITP